MTSIKPNKPEAYNGKRDFLAVHTWLYKMEQYFHLIQMVNPEMQLAENDRVTFAASFLTGPASTWWFTLVQGEQLPTTWKEFRDKVSQEFVPSDHVRRARDKLRNLRHESSVAKYLTDFRNISLTIPDMNDGEKWDRFISGLKKEVRIEVLKSSAPTFEQAATVALRIDGAIMGAEEGGSGAGPSNGANTPTPMEVGNVEGRRAPNPNWNREQLKDFHNNRCFKCKKTGCRPWKCGKGGKKNGPALNNNEARRADANPDAAVSDEENDSSDSEN